jgi:hypothetical protein
LDIGSCVIVGDAFGVGLDASTPGVFSAWTVSAGMAVDENLQALPIKSKVTMKRLKNKT